jgi:hypothetical protein
MLRTGVLYCQSVMQFHATPVSKFIHAHTKNTIFPAPIFAKLNITQRISTAPSSPNFIHFGLHTVGNKGLTADTPVSVICNAALHNSTAVHRNVPKLVINFGRY